MQGVRWPSRAGAWLAIGTSPVAVFSGAELTQQFQTRPGPTALILAGTAGLVLLLALGLRGVNPPTGEGLALGDFLPRYVPKQTVIVVSIILALAMIGWTGYYLGLGAGALASLTGIGRIWFLIPLAALSVVVTGRNLSRWNGIAMTLGLILLIAVTAIAIWIDSPTHTSITPTPTLWSGTAIAFLGYVAVFSLRAPDFSVGLARRRDLLICALFLIIPALLLMAAGATFQSLLGKISIEIWLHENPWGSALLLLSVSSPVFSALHTGGQSLFAAVPRLRPYFASSLIAAASVIAAMAHIEQITLNWLSILASSLPPIIVPLAFEARSRQRRKPAKPVPIWTWGVGAVAGVVASLMGLGYAAPLGIGASLITTSLWRIPKNTRSTIGVKFSYPRKRL